MSWKKRFLFTTCGLFCFALLVEGFSALALAVIFHSWSHTEKLNLERVAVLDEMPMAQDEFTPMHKFDKQTIPHPYFGFALDPDKMGWDFEFAYVDQKSIFQKKSSERYLIAFTGGSVAGQIVGFAKKFLTPELKKLDFFKDKEILYLGLARGGYKQPQQVMTINYLFSLGIELDLVINVDGFNESALPFAELRPRNVFPFFPREWLQAMPSLQNAKSRQLASKIYFVDSLRRDWAITFSNSFLKYSATSNIIWKIGDELALQSLQKWKEDQMIQPLNQRTFFTSGPKVDYSQDSKLVEDIAGVWRRGSELIAAICEKYHVKYLHILQPNQYFANSKNLTREEMQTAFRADHPYREGVVKVYPTLQKQRDELRKKGIVFYDLTGVFLKTNKTVYNDQCCHFNEDGLEILNREIAEIIKSDFAN